MNDKKNNVMSDIEYVFTSMMGHVENRMSGLIYGKTVKVKGGEVGRLAGESADALLIIGILGIGRQLLNFVDFSEVDETVLVRIIGWMTLILTIVVTYKFAKAVEVRSKQK